MHADHVGGVAANGQVVFPNAIIRADKREGEFWLSKESLDKAPEAMKGFFQGAQASMKPYVEAGKYKPFDGAGELVPGIRAVSTYGHTPGHTMYMVESKGQKLAVWGDLMHVAAVQFAEPAVTIQFDSDTKRAAPQRKKAYAMPPRTASSWPSRMCRSRASASCAPTARAIAGCRPTTRRTRRANSQGRARGHRRAFT